MKMNHKFDLFHPVIIIPATNLLLVGLSYFGQSTGAFWSATTIYYFKPSQNYYGEFVILVAIFTSFLLFWNILFNVAIQRRKNRNNNNLTITAPASAYRQNILFFLFTFAFISILKSWVMRDVSFFNILSGNVVAADVEAALDAAPFGLNGIVLQFALLQLLIWRLLGPPKIKGGLLALGNALAIFAFISQGKAQGLMYFAAVHIAGAKTKFEKTVRTATYFLAVLTFFILSRLFRNQNLNLSLSGDWALTTILGNYFGAPFVNGGFMRDVPNPNFAYRYFSYLIPKKLLPQEIIDTYGLPDPTSPTGLIGGLFGFESWTGRLVLLFLMSFAIIFIAKWTRNTPAGVIFRPFFILALLTNTIYNHFLNFSLFWLPLMMAIGINAVNSRKLRKNAKIIQ